MDLLKVKDRVRHLLINYPSCRDSYEETLARIWWHDAKDKEINFRTFLNEYKDKKFSCFQSIERVWRKIQEQEPELRGRSYWERMAQRRYVHEQLGQI